MNRVRDAARDLTVAIGFLQDVIAEEVVGEKERALYGQADQALGAVGLFRASLDEDLTGEQVAKNFDRMDDEVHEQFYRRLGFRGTRPKLTVGS